MEIRAKFGGQCRLCYREIHEGDTIEWEPDEGACHVEPDCDEAELQGRRVGSAATAKPVDLPKYEDDSDEPGLPPGGWENFRPKDRP